jgi:hypothetical protein
MVRCFWGAEETVRVHSKPRRGDPDAPVAIGHDLADPQRDEVSLGLP